MKLVRAAGLGLGLALAGVAVWAVVAYFLKRDLGLMMPVVGAMAGLGVYLALRPPPSAEAEEVGGHVPRWKQVELERQRAKELRASPTVPPGVTFGALAAGVALLAVAAGKVVADRLAAPAESQSTFQYGDADMVRQLATDICKERQSKGQRLAFPPGMVLDRAYHPHEFPPGVWDEAEAKWRQTPPAEQKQRIEERVKAAEDLARSMKSAARPPGFSDRLDTLDLVWFLAALVAAFAVGMRAKPPAEAKEDEE